MKEFTNILRAQRVKVDYEKLDTTPLFVGGDRILPQTLASSVDRILEASNGVEEFESLRGFKYDTETDEQIPFTDDGFDGEPDNLTMGVHSFYEDLRRTELELQDSKAKTQQAGNEVSVEKQEVLDLKAQNRSAPLPEASADTTGGVPPAHPREQGLNGGSGGQSASPDSE